MKAKATDEKIKEQILSALAKHEMTRSKLLRKLGAKVNALKLTEILNQLAEGQQISQRRLTYADGARGGGTTMAWGLWNEPKQIAWRVQMEEHHKRVEECKRQREERAERIRARERWIEYLDELPSLIDPAYADELLDILLTRLRTRPIHFRQHRLWKHSLSIF